VFKFLIGYSRWNGNFRIWRVTLWTCSSFSAWHLSGLFEPCGGELSPVLRGAAKEHQLGEAGSDVSYSFFLQLNPPTFFWGVGGAGDWTKSPAHLK
jgi:hypothetical protein